MTAFAHAITALFADPNMAADATWRAGGTGPAVPVRVIRRAPDRVEGFGAGRFVTDTTLLDLPLLVLPDLAEGDTVEVEGTRYTLRGAPVRDSLRLVWTAEARADADPG